MQWHGAFCIKRNERVPTLLTSQKRIELLVDGGTYLMVSCHLFHLRINVVRFALGAHNNAILTFFVKLFILVSA